ncbi:mitogen-activated protein kinase kinase kinase 1-like [Schistocerca serialis cubense]|uniref:mitogen-activated protein kinase kinase kinase 1-like n=1 Tax=Schistocerca serialis cubense TaxID=2023355 RepID=UPI00214F331E|nr:mitogen-activated protein kinase kinase kinase 1-like [Schistocerca serialis cubense]
MAELMQGLRAGDSSGANQLDHYRAQLRRNTALEEVRGPVVAKHVLQRVKPAPETLPCVDAPGPTAAQLKHCQTPTARCRQSHLHRLSPSLPALVTKHSSSKVKSSPETLPHTDIPGPTAAESKHYQTPPVRWRYSSLHQLSPSLRAPMMKQPSPKAKHPPETLGTPDLVTPQPKHCHPPPASWQQTSLHEQSPSLPSQAPGHVAVQPKRCRTPPASWRQSFVHQLSPSLPSLCPLNQNTHGSRPASPGHMDPILVEMVRRRVRRVQKARLYLLRQPGPNTFSVGGDSPEHKFRVVIGPQTCSCNRGPHCLHLLFVMRRVFQVPENDPRLFAKELKNFEVESLFQNYKEQQNKRILKKQENSNKLPNAACGYPLTGLHEAVQNFFDFHLSADTKIREDEKCPICLLEMTDGESLVECNSGCHNKLHHHCMAVWAAECVQQSEAVLCPLCRHPWMEKSVPNLQENVLLSSDHNSKRPKMSKNKAVRTSSMNTKLSDTSSPIPLQHMSMAADWIKILGSDLVTLLYSQDWKQRERGLQLLQDELHRQVQLSNEEWQQKVIRCCAKILAMLVGDPIFKVYSTCVHSFCTLIRSVCCSTATQLKEFVDLIYPVIKTMLKKCADRNRRASQLSAEALAEISEREIGNPFKMRNTSIQRLMGLEVVLSCILEPFTVDSVSWQWLGGRLLMLKTMFHLFPDEFHLGQRTDDGDRLNKFRRLISVVEFSVKALRSPHRTVKKIAKDVFLLSSSLSIKENGVLNHVLEMLAPLDISLQVTLKKHLLDVAQFHSQASCGNGSAKSVTQIHLRNVAQSNMRNRTGAVNSVPLSESKQLTNMVATKMQDLELKNLKKCKSLKHFSESNPVSSFSPTNKWMNSLSKASNLVLINKKEENVTSKDKVSQNFTETCNEEHFSMVPDSSQGSDVQTFTHTCESESLLSPAQNMSCTLNISCQDFGHVEANKDKPCTSVFSTRTAGDGSDVQYSVETEGTAPDFYCRLVSEVTWHHLNTHSYIEGINWKRGPALGTGAYSTCFQARDTMSGGIMAVKQVSFLRNSQQEQERVESEIWKEIVMLSKLHHPNVLHILGATKQNGHFNIFVEWMAGGSIATLLDSYGPFSESVIINYTKQTLQGLNYLHKNHILHRDLKGANLLIDSTGRNLCIGDFGAAVHLETQTVVSGELQGQILGTIAFMAPEVLRGENYEHSCDIWSVGCCIIEMVTTKPPWKENQMSNHLALMYKIASSKEPPFIPHTLGMLLKNVAHKCLQIKPELRPTAKELLNHECFINTPEYIGTCSNNV